ADGRLDDAERQAVLDALRGKFSLSEAELADLFELAHEQSENAHDLHSYTGKLNESLDEPQRIRVFQLLWEVAYADGHADAHESHLLRKLADLLHIRHGDAIGAKLRAESGKPAR
ncbi:MAG: TerB family tellurite resistance protein, partial [Steroidobacteraceae bacterium]